MKKYSYFVGLLVFHPLISARYSSFTTSVINSNHYSLPLKHAKHTQAVIPAAQTAPDKKYKRNIESLLGIFWVWLLARFDGHEKRRRVKTWRFEDPALLKIIKTNALRLWNSHCPDRKIIRLEDWK